MATHRGAGKGSGYREGAWSRPRESVAIGRERRWVEGGAKRRGAGLRRVEAGLRPPRCRAGGGGGGGGSMAWSRYQLGLAALMLLTGSINTLAAK